MGTLPVLCTAVVMRTLYVERYEKNAAGVNVATSFVAFMLGAELANARQVVKSSADTCTEPVHGPFKVCPISVAGFIAVLNEMRMGASTAAFVWPSEGVTETI